MQPPLLAFVGGFLGAGKTTLILAAARILNQRGLRTAIITNDQDSRLVDSLLAEAQDMVAGEVAGGCFCCRFSDLMAAADALEAHQPDVIFAEPVGSCVDLSATILHPLLDLFPDRYRLAPLTVLMDAELAERVSSGQADPDIAFLFRHQLAEADLVACSKLDRTPDYRRLPFPVDFALSAVTGEGIEGWLDEILNPTRVVGAHILDIDYARYAEAEAALGWLNLHAAIDLHAPLSPAALAGPLLDDLDRSLTECGVAIAHLKVFDRASSGYIKAGICSNGDEPMPVGDLTASPAAHHDLVINLRAAGDPELLLDAVRVRLRAVAGDVAIRHQSASRPSPPLPEHRITTR